MRFLLFVALLCFSQLAHARTYFKYSYDGKYIARGESNCSVTLFEAATGNKIYSKKDDYVYDCPITLNFTQNHRYALLGNILFDIQEKKEIGEFDGMPLAVDFNNKYIAYVNDYYNQITILDLKTLKSKSFTVEIDLFFSNSMTFSSDSKYLIHDTGYGGHGISDRQNVYRVKDLKLMNSYYVDNAAFSPNGKYLFSDNEIFNPVTGKLLKKFTGRYYQASFSKDNKTFAIQEFSPDIAIVYDMNFHELARVPKSTHDRFSIAVESNKLFIYHDDDKIVEVWDIEYTKKLSVIPYSGRFLDFSPDGNYFVTEYGEVISVETGNKILDLNKDIL